TWHTINAVYAQKSRLALQSMRYDIVDPTGIDRLLRLIERREGHWMAMQIEHAKIALTERDSHAIELGQIEAGLRAALERPLFDEALAPLLERVRDALAAMLNAAGIAAGSVDTLFFTGGSSGIPALREAVCQLLPNARVADGDNFGSIGSGLAIEARRRYGWGRPAASARPQPLAMMMVMPSTAGRSGSWSKSSQPMIPAKTMFR